MAGHVTPGMILLRYREAIAVWERNLKQASDALYTARQLQAPQDTIDTFEAKVLEANRNINRLRRERAAFMARYANGQEPQP